jgi:hypothetical protein
MNRKLIITSILLGIATLIGGCGRNVARASTDAGLMSEQVPTFHDAHEEYVQWKRESGRTQWQRERARELSAIRGVGGRID